MGKWLHKLSEKNAISKTAFCSQCDDLVKIQKVGVLKSGNPRWRCANARNLEKRIYNKPYILYKKDVCERCGFVPEHECQLDVDHIDGNHSNNDPANLQTLCANCHRLKTKLNDDYHA